MNGGLLREFFFDGTNNATMLDTTVYISVSHQSAIVVRYVIDEVREILIGLIICHDTTGQGMFKSLEDCLPGIGLDLKDIVGSSTGGAVNMQGKYNGFMGFCVQGMSSTLLL